MSSKGLNSSKEITIVKGGGEIKIKIPLALMGVLAHGSAHGDPPLGPQSTLEEIFRHVCLQSGLQTSQRGKRNITALHRCRAVIFHFPFCSVKIGLIGGVGGVTEFFSSMES